MYTHMVHLLRRILMCSFYALTHGSIDVQSLGLDNRYLMVDLGVTSFPFSIYITQCIYTYKNIKSIETYHNYITYKVIPQNTMTIEIYQCLNVTSCREDASSKMYFFSYISDKKLRSISAVKIRTSRNNVYLRYAQHPLRLWQIRPCNIMYSHVQDVSESNCTVNRS